MKNFKLWEFIVPSIITYLVFAFSYWDLNPESWDIEFRVLCAIVMVASTAITFAIIEDLKRKAN